MKKARKKFIKRLERYIGKEIIRIGKTHFSCDSSYTDQPVVLCGFTRKGEMIIKYTGFMFEFVTKEEDILPLEFTDDLWISYKKALKARNNCLNKWRGQKIRRICPTKEVNCRSFMTEPAILISASKHHLKVEFTDFILKGESCLLNYRYANPNEWELVEE